MSESAERQKQYAKYYKDRNRCVRCHKQDAYTLNGRSMCAECVEKDREYSKIRYKNGKQRHRETILALRSDRLSKGLCYICGKPQDKVGRKTCEKCAAKERARYFSRKDPSTLYHQETLDRASDGFCYRCGNPVKTGLTVDFKPYKICEKCWQDNVKAAEKGRATQLQKYDMSGFATNGFPTNLDN